MALGIFGAAALRNLPGGADLVLPVAAVVGLAWLGVAASLLGAICRHGIRRYVRPIRHSFAIGTWVAGTAVAARMAMLGAPGAPWASVVLFVLSAALWLGFMPLAISNLLRLARAPDVLPDGTILLVTVATQAIALIALRLFPALPAAHAVAATLCLVGVGCYALGAALVIGRIGRAADWRLDRDWSNGNCILHGALSITGLTAVVGDFIARDARSASGSPPPWCSGPSS